MIKTVFAVVALSMAAAATAQTKSGHATANGVSYYYEIRGKGEPLLLLHGGLGSIDMFRPALRRWRRTAA